MSLSPLTRAAMAGLLLCFPGGAAIACAGDRDSRIEAAAEAAEVVALRQALVSGESATAVLDRWCSDHRLAPAGSVKAEKLPPDAFPIPRAAGAKLRQNGRVVAKRRVRLRCGETLLSEARLWFLPNLLTPDMRRQLATTTRPFGAVVAPLRFRRVQSRIAILSIPGGAHLSDARADLLSVEAFLVLPDGRPFAFTQEVYKASLLKGAVPRSHLRP